MIDEEEDEDVLEKGTSWKNVLKNIFVIIMMIVGILFIYFGFGMDQTQSLFLGFMFICLGTTLLQIQKEPKEPKKQTLTILKCESCGLAIVRDYQEGDYVYKEMGECDACDGTLKITQIYSVKLKDKKSKKKVESMKKPEPTPLTP